MVPYRVSLQNTSTTKHKITSNKHHPLWGKQRRTTTRDTNTHKMERSPDELNKEEEDAATGWQMEEHEKILVKEEGASTSERAAVTGLSAEDEGRSDDDFIVNDMVPVAPVVVLPWWEQKLTKVLFVLVCSLMAALTVAVGLKKNKTTAASSTSTIPLPSESPIKQVYHSSSLRQGVEIGGVGVFVEQNLQAQAQGSSSFSMSTASLNEDEAVEAALTPSFMESFGSRRLLNTTLCAEPNLCMATAASACDNQAIVCSANEVTATAAHVEGPSMCTVGEYIMLNITANFQFNAKRYDVSWYTYLGDPLQFNDVSALTGTYCQNSKLSEDDAILNPGIIIQGDGDICWDVAGSTSFNQTLERNTLYPCAPSAAGATTLGVNMCFNWKQSGGDTNCTVFWKEGIGYLTPPNSSKCQCITMEVGQVTVASQPSSQPTSPPTNQPTAPPTRQPTSPPSTAAPSRFPTNQPTSFPTSQPTRPPKISQQQISQHHLQQISRHCNQQQSSI